MNEAELRDTPNPWPKSLEELTTYIKDLVEQKHDYGACVYAMSLSAVAAFNYVCHELGTTGFQASCADLDIIRRVRDLKGPFRIVDYSNLLFPQYLNDERVPGWEDALKQEHIKKWLKEEAAKKLAAFEKEPVHKFKDDDGIEKTYDAAHPNVVAHWRMLVNL